MMASTGYVYHKKVMRIDERRRAQARERKESRLEKRLNAKLDDVKNSVGAPQPAARLSLGRPPTALFQDVGPGGGGGDDDDEDADDPASAAMAPPPVALKRSVTEIDFDGDGKADLRFYALSERKLRYASLLKELDVVMRVVYAVAYAIFLIVFFSIIDRYRVAPRSYTGSQVGINAN